LGSDLEVFIFVIEIAPAVQGFDLPRVALRRLRLKVLIFLAFSQRPRRLGGENSSGHTWI
jgi:hypothetical protein